MVPGAVVLCTLLSRKGDMTCTDGKQVILCSRDLPCPDAVAAGRARAARWRKTVPRRAQNASHATAGRAIRRGAVSATAWPDAVSHPPATLDWKGGDSLAITLSALAVLAVAVFVLCRHT